jgi:hypothetical protein
VVNLPVQVKNPNTGEFFQLEDLRSLGAVPADFRKNKKPKNYPFKRVDTIIRIKKADGTEWLAVLAKQSYYSLDHLIGLPCYQLQMRGLQ